MQVIERIFESIKIIVVLKIGFNLTNKSENPAFTGGHILLIETIV